MANSNFLSKYDSFKELENGNFKVERDWEYNIVDSDGNELSELWFEWIDDEYKHGVARVRLDDKYNLIDMNGKLLSDMWFDMIMPFYNNRGSAEVVLNDKYNLIDTKGKIVFVEWFDCISYFNDNLIVVRTNNNFKLIDIHGNFHFDSYDWVGNYIDGFIQVRLNGKYNFIDSKGEYFSDVWFDHAEEFKNGCAKVVLNGKSFKISRN